MRFCSTILLAILIAGCNAPIESSHPTLAAAKEGIERGWIPSVLPSSSAQIKESHELDCNAGHGTFVFGAEGIEQFQAALAPLASGEKIHGIHVPCEQMEREGYSFYTYNDFYLAVNWSRHCGEFWLGYSH
jgi:hypothetical protein